MVRQQLSCNAIGVRDDQRLVPIRTRVAGVAANRLLKIVGTFPTCPFSTGNEHAEIVLHDFSTGCPGLGGFMIRTAG